MFSAGCRIVALGGGTGLPAVLRAVRTAIGGRGSITAIVTMMDDGGSSGVLRRRNGTLPPGDVRNCLGALAASDNPLSAILHDRRILDVNGGAHPVGNVLLAALAERHGSFVDAVETVARMLGVDGRVLPVTLDSTHLCAEFRDGAVVRGESAIARRGGQITRLTLCDQVAALPAALDAIARADLIVLGPGSLYTSVIPPLLVPGIASAIARSAAATVYVANLMTQPGETDAYTLSDHVRAVLEHAGGQLLDYVVAQDAPLPALVRRAYADQGATPVNADVASWPFRAVLVPRNVAGVSPGQPLRHDISRLGEVLISLLEPAAVNGIATHAVA